MTASDPRSRSCLVTVAWPGSRNAVGYRGAPDARYFSGLGTISRFTDQCDVNKDPGSQQQGKKTAPGKPGAGGWLHALRPAPHKRRTGRLRFPALPGPNPCPVQPLRHCQRAGLRVCGGGLGGERFRRGMRSFRSGLLPHAGCQPVRSCGGCGQTATGWRQGNAFPIWNAATCQEDGSFVVGI
jgi:hypothetical protein